MSVCKPILQQSQQHYLASYVAQLTMDALPLLIKLAWKKSILWLWTESTQFWTLLILHLPLQNGAAVPSSNWRSALIRLVLLIALILYVCSYHIYKLIHFFPNMLFTLIKPSALWKQRDLAVLNANIFPTQLLAYVVLKSWKLMASAKISNYITFKKGLCQQKLF